MNPKCIGNVTFNLDKKLKLFVNIEVLHGDPRYWSDQVDLDGVVLADLLAHHHVRVFALVKSDRSSEINQ